VLFIQVRSNGRAGLSSEGLSDPFVGMIAIKARAPDALYASGTAVEQVGMSD
jgi:hypothetical protein